MFVPLLIPTGSDHDRSTTPYATIVLIGLNTVVYLVMLKAPDPEAVWRQMGFVAANPLPHQFVTHLFFHAGFFHLIGNMAYLWFAGSDLEDALGRVRLVVVYFLGGFASALLFWWTAVAAGFPNLHEAAVGASGAVSALLGLYLVRFPRFKIRLWYAAIVLVPFVMRQGIARISSWVFIGFWILLQLYSGLAALRAGGAEVAYWGHIGGFFLGLAYGLITRQARLGHQEFLMKEANHLFYKQKWHSAMEWYQKVLSRDPRCVDAYVKWALCWECAGMPKRAEKVLREALAFYRQNGWEREAAAIEAELSSMTGEKSRHTSQRKEDSPAAGPPNLLFRRDPDWKSPRP